MIDPAIPPVSTAPAKADPETIALRAAPGRVTRFRRGAIVAIAAVGSTAIVGVTWLALKPASIGMIAPADDKRTEEHRSEIQSLMRNSYAVLWLKKNTLEQIITKLK